MTAIEAVVLTFLLNALWQVPAVVLAASLGERLLRRAPARWRHAFWIAALAACVLLPAASLLPEPPDAAPPPPELPAGLRAASPTDGPTRSTSNLRSLESPSFARSAAALLYGLVVTAHGIRLGRSWWRARVLVRTAWPPTLSSEASVIAERCRAAFRLEALDILGSDRVVGPVTLGAVRPVVLLPPELLGRSTADELTSILGHEMAHIRRRDYAVHLAGEILLLPVSFHPAVRRLRRRLAETREMACDEAVVERLIGARAYARSLLSLAASIAGLPRPALTLGVLPQTDADTLEERMKRLIDPRSRLGARLALAALSLALLVLAGTGLAASSLAVRAATTSSAATSWSPFLGVWQSDFPDKEGRKLPGSELEVRMTNGQPEAILTFYRHLKNEDGSVRTDAIIIPAYDLALDGRTLTYRFRTALQYREGARREILEHGARLELTGKDEGIVTTLAGKFAADPAQIPPAPPPQSVKRIR